MRSAVVNIPIIDQFSAFNDDGYTKISGLIQADFDVRVWVDGAPSAVPLSIAEIGTSGEYSTLMTPTSIGYWKTEIEIKSNHEILVYEAEVATTGLTEVDGKLTVLIADLSRVLGLLHHNAILDNQTYDSNNQLTSARLRVFDSAGHVPVTPGGSEVLGLTQEYSIVAEYDGLAIVKRYALTRVL